MTDTILIGAVGQYFDGTTVRTLGVSSAEYHDPALASSLERGTFLPVLRAAGVEWEESIRFQPQGGSPDAQVSNLPLIATGGTFDAWSDYQVAGFSWTVKRGRPDQAWEDWELVFEAIGQGIEWRGRKEMIIRLRDRFAALSEPVSQIVFDDAVANERYRNRLAPAVYGDVQQVRALVIDPAFFRAYAASNLGIVRRVTEGGRPTDNWIEVENGYQVLQSTVQDALPISADIGGPPLPATALEDEIAEFGSFPSFTSGDPDGWTVSKNSPASDITEDAVNGGANITASRGVAASTSALTASSSRREFENNAVTETTPADDSTWASLLETDDTDYVEMTVKWGSGVIPPRVVLSDFGAAVGGDQITGIEVDILAAKSGPGTMPMYFNSVRIILPNGTVLSSEQQDVLVSGASFTTYTFGGSDDLWGLDSLSADVVNSPDFQIMILGEGRGAGTRPVSITMDRVTLTIHTNSGADNLALYYDNALTSGERYRLSIYYDDLSASPSDSISVRFAGVAAALDAIPDYKIPAGSTAALLNLPDSTNTSDPSVLTSGAMEEAGVLEGEFIADGAVLGLEFFQAPGQTGEMRVTRIACQQISLNVNRFKDLIRALVSDAGFDPDTDIVNAELDAVAAATGNPPMGWYVKNQTRRLQLMTLFAQSLGAAVWGGIDGKIHAALMALPAQPSGDYLKVGPERCMGPSTVVKDEGPDLRDRTHAAQNIDPLRDSETAGVTETWPETERQKVLADWRITERVSFARIAAGAGWPVPTPVDVQVTNPDTGSVTNADGYAYTNAPKPPNVVDLEITNPDSQSATEVDGFSYA